MNYCLYPHLYLHFKHIFTLKKSSTLANLLTGKNVRKSPEERNFKKRTCIFI